MMFYEHEDTVVIGVFPVVVKRKRGCVGKKDALDAAREK
jgi:hypothetical protein